MSAGATKTKWAEQQLRPTNGGRPQGLQTEFKAMPKAQPLVSLDHARTAIAFACDVQYGVDELEQEIECGEFEWVFDIASITPPRVLRIFWPCVLQRIEKLKNPKWRVKRFVLDEIMAALFPGRQPYTKTPRIEVGFACSPDLVIDLIDAGELEQFGASEYRRGRGGEALITLDSIERFLKERQVI